MSEMGDEDERDNGGKLGPRGGCEANHAGITGEISQNGYEPDCDYVDGELEERNAGEERALGSAGLLHHVAGSERRAMEVRSIHPEIRMRVSPTRV